MKSANSARVSLDEIARAVGVSRMTISLVLRQRPGPSAATRTQVLAAAERLGYRPDPLVSAYQARIRTRRPTSYQANLAWINVHPSKDFWHRSPWAGGYLAGARQRAAQLGFQLEEIHIPPGTKTRPGTPVAALERILEARGIHGLLLPWPEPTLLSRHNWPRHAVALIGCGEGSLHPRLAPDAPIFHGARPDIYHNFSHAFQRLTLSGRQRIGLAIENLNDELAGARQRACLHVCQSTLLKKNRIPPLIVPGFDREGIQALLAWTEKWQPDALLLYNDDLVSFLKKAGWSIPKQIRVAQLNLTDGPIQYGIDALHHEIAAAAVDLTISQLMRNETGPPAHPKEVLIKGIWQE